MKIKYLLPAILCFTSFFNTLAASELEARGATFPKAVYEDWMQAYEAETGKKIHYTPTGSGDGIVSAVKRKADFSGTDKPLRSWRLKRYKLNMFPTVVGSIVLAYHLPGVEDGALRLDEEAIGAIFAGEIKYWDDHRITQHNKELNLPHQPIKVVVRSDGSGTTYNFTYYLRKIDYDDFKRAEKKYDWKAQTIGAEGSSGMSETIKETPYSIGYTDFSSKQKYNLSVAVLKNKSGEWVVPSLLSATEGAKYAKLKKKNNFYGIIAYPHGKTSYPIIATSFVLLPYENTKKNKEIIDFFEWAFLHGESIANKHGFALLPKETLGEINTYWGETVLN